MGAVLGVVDQNVRVIREVSHPAIVEGGAGLRIRSENDGAPVGFDPETRTALGVV